MWQTVSSSLALKCSSVYSWLMKHRVESLN